MYVSKAYSPVVMTMARNTHGIRTFIDLLVTKYCNTLAFLNKTFLIETPNIIEPMQTGTISKSSGNQSGNMNLAKSKLRAIPILSL